MSLQQLGWSAFFQALCADRPLRPARIISQGGDRFVAHDGSRESMAAIRGRLRKDANYPPAVGDWVLLSPLEPGRLDDQSCVIEEILPRRTAICRRQSGKVFGAQVLAANIDRAVLVMALDQDFSLPRLERYLTLVWESGASPILVLSKADLVSDPSVFVSRVENRAMGFPVICLSNVSGQGREELAVLLRAGETIVLLGSSGVGKSTLVNALGGSALRRIGTVRNSDGKGRHTTTDRHLLRLPSGVLVLDTPGLREVQLWAGEDSLDQTFAEIAAAATGCRFRDCRHQGEPDCAVAKAVHCGQIAADRLESFHQLTAELEHLKRQGDPRLANEYKSEIKKIHRAQKQHYKMSRKQNPS